MRILPTLACKPGMKTGKPIFSTDGKVLVGYGVSLTDGIISRLNHMGYEFLFVEDPNTDDIYIEDTIRMETRLALRVTLQRLFETVVNHPKRIIDGTISLSKIFYDSVNMVIEDLKEPKNPTIMLINTHPTEINRLEEHFLQNAINVCVFATKIGFAEGLSGQELYSFSLAALLHDIGNILTPKEIIQKPAILTDQETAEIRRHCEMGYELIKNQEGIPTYCSIAVLQHHERFDGSGYPFGLKGNEIHPFAQWIGLIDSYDAMTNPRSYRKAMLPNEAMEILYAGAGTLFDLEKVQQFRNKVAIFPVGLSVSLSTGAQGIVAKVNENCIHRPIVRVLKDEEGQMLKQPYEIDLSQKLNIMIDKIGEAV